MFWKRLPPHLYHSPGCELHRRNEVIVIIIIIIIINNNNNNNGYFCIALFFIRNELTAHTVIAYSATGNFTGTFEKSSYRSLCRTSNVLLLRLETSVIWFYLIFPRTKIFFNTCAMISLENSCVFTWTCGSFVTAYHTVKWLAWKTHVCSLGLWVALSWPVPHCEMIGLKHWCVFTRT